MSPGGPIRQSYAIIDYIKLITGQGLRIWLQVNRKYRRFVLAEELDALNLRIFPHQNWNRNYISLVRIHITQLAKMLKPFPHVINFPETSCYLQSVLLRIRIPFFVFYENENHLLETKNLKGPFGQIRLARERSGTIRELIFKRL
jgi:hypothetical protein